MIVVYPMLTEPGISKNVIPAICKVLERFVIVYRMDEIFKMTGNAPSGSVKLGPIGHIDFQLKEALDLLEAGATGSKSGNQTSYGNKNKGKTTDVKVGVGSASKGDAKVDKPNQNEIMLEPTYVTLNTKVGPRMVGVKVLPFPVMNGNIIELMNKDIKLTGASLKFQKFSRLLKRAFKLKRRATVSGDVFNDIVLATTKHKGNTFLLVNHAEMENEFDYTASQIHKLHKLGWSSFAFADDVNKRAMFCMKEFKGMCSTIPYSFMLTSMSKDVNKAFEDLEDARRSAAPFFSRKLSMKKVIGEQIDSSDINQDILNEGILDFFRKFNKAKADKASDDISSAAKSNNDSKIDSSLKDIPNVNISSLKSVASKQIPDFKKSYDFALKVVNNSMQNSDKKMNESIAAGIALRATAKEGDVQQNTRDELKENMPVLLRSTSRGIKTIAYALIAHVLMDKTLWSTKTKVGIFMLILAKGVAGFLRDERKAKDLELKRANKQADKETARANKTTRAKNSSYIQVKKGD